MLNVTVPSSHGAERAWVINVILSEHLGVEYRLCAGEGFNVVIEADGRHVEVPDTFFSLAGDNWFTEDVRPETPLATWDPRPLSAQIETASQNLPILFGDGELSIASDNIRLPVDIFGSAFFMLSRCEEITASDRDRHHRFPVSQATTFKANILDRPIVDEYTEVLWAALSRLWPTLHRKRLGFESCISCDVDIPFDYTINTPGAALRRLAGDILKRRSLASTYDTARYVLDIKRRGLAADRMFKFDWMMDACEREGHSCSFNFITANRDPLDCPPYWNSKQIDALIRRIHGRGHEIGLHASYRSFDRPEFVREEFDRLRRKCESLGISQNRWGGRQHYLRWSAGETWRHWSQAGLDYDSTLTHAERPGYRCGTCRPYSTFDLKTRSALRLREEPLIVMEASVLKAAYLGLDNDQALDTIRHFVRVTRKFSGKFSLLWHNSTLITQADRDLYRQILADTTPQR